MSSCKISKKPLKLPSRRFKRAERGFSAFWIKKKKKRGVKGGRSPPAGGVGGEAEPPPCHCVRFQKSLQSSL